MRTKSETRPTTVDQYLAMVSDDQRAALERVRKIVHEAAPGVEEGISYQIPEFRLNGKRLLYMGAAKNHCAIYGIDGANSGDLEGYDTSGKGTVRFEPDDPLPAALIKKLVKTRAAKIKGKTSGAPVSSPASARKRRE
jgi:uncharacterized protein YdhG (YjbR/CyaY superfamily)